MTNPTQVHADALNILRKARGFVGRGLVLRGRWDVRHMLVDALHQAVHDRPESPAFGSRAAAQTPEQRYLPGHFKGPAASRALACVCRALPRPTPLRDNGSRLRKINAWSCNLYVGQHVILKVLDRAVDLAATDLFDLKERHRLQFDAKQHRQPQARLRLVPWTPDTSAPRTPAHPVSGSLEKAADDALLVTTPYHMPGRQQELALAARLHGLALFKPWEALAGIPAYDALGRVVNYHTRVVDGSNATTLTTYDVRIPDVPGDAFVRPVDDVRLALTLNDGTTRDYPIPWATQASHLYDWKPILLVSRTAPDDRDSLRAFLAESIFYFFPGNTDQHFERLRTYFLDEVDRKLDDPTGSLGQTH